MRALVDLRRMLWQLPWRDWAFLADAVFWLAFARIAIVVLPFRSVARLASCPARVKLLPQQSRTIPVSRVRWAVVASARRVPWRALCFEQGLAAHFMLQRRGVPSVLYYGAAPDTQRGLLAHVWVRAGDIDVIGGEIASRYAVLGTFPPQGQGGSSPTKQWFPVQ